MLKTFLSALIFIALFSGCDDSISSPDSATLPGGYTVFDTANGNLPYPNNIMFAGSDDATLNIPNPSNNPVIAGLNTLDGFSTTSPITVSLEGDIVTKLDGATLATAIHLYEASELITQNGIPIIGQITRELQYGKEYIAVITTDEKGEEGTLALVPRIPLSPATNYVVSITKEMKTTDGRSLVADPVSAMINSTEPLVDAQGEPVVYFHDATSARKLEGLRRINQATFAALFQNAAAKTDNACTTADGKSFTCNNVVMSWSFKTQSIGKIAEAFSDENSAGTIIVQDTNMTSKDILQNPAMQGIAEVYAGVLANVPYYLSAPSAENPVAPRTQPFVMQEGTALPKLQKTTTVPLLMTVPKGPHMPAAGWPVVIFQHGITRNRLDALAISEAMARGGYVVVSIDLPLHGVTKTNPLKTAYERTFDLDLLDNATGAPGADGKIDESGAHYINLRNLLVSRDNMRQSTSDFITLLNALDSVQGVAIDATKVAFIGHSLGAMAPFGFFSHRKLDSVVLAMPGSGIAQLLNHSETFGPIIQAGLRAEGIEPGSKEYASFMLAVQTVLDDADPANYATKVRANQKALLAFEVFGDKVIPNAVATAPLSGTDPIVRMLALNDVNTSNPGYLEDPYLVSRYKEGAHGSILDPSDSLKATVDMQYQAAIFTTSEGTNIDFRYPEIIK